MGGAGDDAIASGNGFDYLDGGDGNDTVLLANDTHAIAIDLTTGNILYTSLEAEEDAVPWQVFNFEHASGTRFDDTLTGDGGDNQLDGNDGNDILIGGGGNNVLTGGEGSDRFDLAANGFAAIADFQTGIDTLGLPTGIAFADLAIVPDTDPAHTAIWNGTHLIARLEGISSSAIAAENFQHI